METESMCQEWYKLIFVFLYFFLVYVIYRNYGYILDTSSSKTEVDDQDKSVPMLDKKLQSISEE